MNWNRWRRAWLAGALLLGASACLSCAVVPWTKTPWGPTRGMAPWPLLVGVVEGHAGYLLVDSPEFACTIDKAGTGKAVLLGWDEVATGNLFHQSIPVGYYVTAVKGSSREMEFFVGGKDEVGRTILEVFVVDRPTVEGGASLGRTGSEPKVSFPALRSRQRIFSRLHEDQDMVESMARHQGARDVLCVKFHTTGSVYNIPYTSYGSRPSSAAGDPPAEELVAYRDLHPDVNAGQALHLLGLEEFHPLMIRWHHKAKGYVMCLQSENGDGLALVLSDVDKDTRFDGVDRVLTTKDWVEAGFGSSVELNPIE